VGTAASAVRRAKRGVYLKYKWSRGRIRPRICAYGIRSTSALKTKRPGLFARAENFANLLRDRFLLNHHFQMRGHILV
jgi:hypothetical protein